MVKSGSSFTSDIFSVSVEYKCDGHSLTEFLVCKVPYLRQFYASMKEVGYYDQETYMYETVIPKLMEISPLSVTPKHYITTKSDVLVLEDLTKQGYYLADQVLWNFNQSVLLLEELARFHAASVKLHLENPAIVEAASRVTLFRKSLIARTMKCVYPRLLACLQAEKVDPLVLESFASYEQEINEGDIWTICNRVCDFKALNHCNLKANNILLKNDGDTPVSVKILDYQTCVWNSPAFDLLLFFVVTVDCDVFQKHSHEFVDCYLTSLNERLLNLGCDCTYTKDDYLADVAGSRLYQVFVLLFAGLFDLREALPGFFFGENFPEVPSADEIEKIRHSERFSCRFSKWFSHFQSLGYFDQ